MEDERIIELYFERSEAAIAQTALKYGAYLGRIAWNVLRDPSDCEECVNDAYMKTWNAIPPARPSSLKSFIGRIARNLAIDRYNSNNAGKRGGGEIALCLDELAECVASREDPEAALSHEELVKLINGYLAGKDEQSVRMFIRRYWYMDSISDVAAKCGCSDSKVKTTLFRMRGELKALLEREGMEI